MTRAARATPLPWLGGLLALYLGVPVLAFAVRLATSNQRGFGQPGLAGALYVSVTTATISAALVAVLGVPLAYVLARSSGRLAAAVGVAVQLPLALPPLMSGILLVELVGPYSTLGQAFARHLTDSMAGVVLAQTFVASPFLVVTARSAFASVDQSIAEHAATLGHRELARFWRVHLPIAGPGIRAGLVLAWLRAFGEYGATVILAYHPFTLPVYTYVQFSGTGIPNTQAPTALALAVAVLVGAAARLRRPAWARRPPPLPPPPPVPASAAVARSVASPVACDLDVGVGTFRLRIAHRAVSPRLAVLGPSGSGKSLTLRALAGLLGAEAGSVAYGGRRVESVPVEDRRIGYVPQGYGLHPNLTVWQQVIFGVGADPGLGAHWLGRLHLDGLERRLPGQLSGGQRQRVALAQALARAPELVLLDEPFSALDTVVRHQLRRELRHVQREASLSTVLVTHDPDEAALLADEVIILGRGRVLQAGPTGDVFTAPASPEVAALLGFRNLLPGRVVAGGGIDAGGVRLAADTRLSTGSQVVWGVRPERVAVGSDGAFAARVVDVAPLGGSTSIVVVLPGGLELEARLPHETQLAPGSPCRVSFPSAAVAVWPASPRETVGAVGA